jgi:hypothetical protein
MNSFLPMDPDVLNPSVTNYATLLQTNSFVSRAFPVPNTSISYTDLSENNSISASPVNISVGKFNIGMIFDLANLGFQRLNSGTDHIIGVVGNADLKGQHQFFYIWRGIRAE